MHHTTHTRGDSLVQEGSHTRAVSLAHAAPLTRGAPFTHGVLGSTHSGTLATTPLAHGGALTHGVALTPFTTHTGTITLGILATSRAPGASIPPKLRAHPFAALAPSTPLGTTELTWS